MYFQVPNVVLLHCSKVVAFPNHKNAVAATLRRGPPEGPPEYSAGFIIGNTLSQTLDLAERLPETLGTTDVGRSCLSVQKFLDILQNFNTIFRGYRTYCNGYYFIVSLDLTFFWPFLYTFSSLLLTIGV